MTKARCGICNVDVEDWAKHEKSKQHQKYLNDPVLMNKLLSENTTNVFRTLIGARQVRVKPSDQIDTKNPNDLWNWHVAVRDSGCDVQEIRENIMAIFLFLLDKYGQSDYRAIHVKTVLDRDVFDSQDLEDTRYIIHAEAEGITHETDDAHGSWLKTLKDRVDSKPHDLVEE